MNCIYHRWRTKNYQKYQYCVLNKYSIKDECENCSFKTPRINKTIKKRSTKLNKLERERDKGRIKKGICENCGKYSERLDPHEVYGGANRKISIINKMIMMICRECHQNEEEILKMKKKYEEEYEKTHTREEFIKLIGKSYLRKERNKC